MRHALPVVALVAALMTQVGCDDGECTDVDEDGFGVGGGCEASDCNDNDPLHHADCLSCSDVDKDGRGVGCDLGVDCAPSNELHWADCGSCADADLDGRGAACDLGTDCSDDDPDQFSSCSACVDSDGDGSFAGCDAFVNRAGPDCDDADPDNYLRCDFCADTDGDGRFANCDGYTSHQGPDCNDTDSNNWSSCTSCRDADGDTYSIGCDAYANGLKGPDCNDGSALHWTDCGNCTDNDLDGRGAGACNLGADCNDSFRDAWTSCASCADGDTDGYWAGCDAYTQRIGVDCNDGDASTWTACATCVDLDNDGRWTGCNTYTTAKPGPDCNDQNANAWSSCGTCRDNDMDTYFIGCDAYATVTGPDCGDTDRNNWTQCSTCLDTDGDSRFAGCDSYTTILGPDCAPSSNQHWADCGNCVDTDGDGRGTACDLGPDCDETSTSHWDDCSTCTDADDDGYGIGTCNVVGLDCADGDPARNPGAADATRNLIDENCDGYDGASLFTDNFDDGVFTPQWTTVSGDTAIQSTYRVSGSFAMNLGGSTGNAQSLVFDTSVCSALYWRYVGKRGPDSPESSDNLQLQYWNGTAYVVSDQWFGTTFVTDPGFNQRFGYISATDSRSAGFRLRLATLNGSSFSDDFFVDDVLVGCAPDADGDHFADPVDCAPNDNAHWNDCSVCIDTDFDDYGPSCNLGADCPGGENDPNINPVAPDTVGDSIDQNCDGVDGTLVTTTFSATPNTAITDNQTSAITCGAAGSISSAIVVTTPVASINDVDVTVNITHPFTGDLDIFLRYDDGVNPVTCIELSTDNGFGANYTSTVFSDEAPGFITSGGSPFTGSYRPEVSLTGLDAKPMVGTYTLFVTDDGNLSFAGTLTSWSIAIKHL